MMAAIIGRNGFYLSQLASVRRNDSKLNQTNGNKYAVSVANYGI